MTFEATFAERVTPGLIDLCAKQAALMAILDLDYHEAFHTVWRRAVKLGAMQLPQAMQDALERGLAHHLFVLWLEADVEQQKREEQSNRWAADVRRWDAEVRLWAARESVDAAP